MAGCSQQEPKAAPKRIKPAITGSKTIKLDSGEMVVVDLPDYQRCYVWRDIEFKTASLQCPSDATDYRVGNAQDGNPGY